MDRPELLHVDDPSYVSLLFPWLVKHGICIMPIPNKLKIDIPIFYGNILTEITSWQKTTKMRRTFRIALGFEALSVECISLLEKGQVK